MAQKSFRTRQQIAHSCFEYSEICFNNKMIPRHIYEYIKVFATVNHCFRAEGINSYFHEEEKKARRNI